MGESKLWGGRFSKPAAELVDRFNASIGFDIRLFNADIDGSLAQADALLRAGVLTESERDFIVNGLEQVRNEIADGRFTPAIADEDIHMAVERRLTEIVGPPGGKIHTGRSRNDQVALDVRLYLREELRSLSQLLIALQWLIVEKAEQEIDTFLPGYTHLQQAQPVRLGHYLLALFWMIDRDHGRLADAWRRADRMPLGSGALAGSGFPVDRDYLCERLGFTASTENSIDAIADRDHLAETVFACAQLVSHLSRFAEDWIVWSSKEFGFVELDDAYSTGSSMMPQKKNPDTLELIRGKAARVAGSVTTLLGIQKGLSLTYGKDLQEDKEPLFDALDTARNCVLVFHGVLETMRFDRDRMRAALDPGLYATDLADLLVRRGMPFREAHRVVGRIVGKAEYRGVPLNEMPWEELKSECDLFEQKDIETLTPESSTDARKVSGGTARTAVLEQLSAARNRLEEAQGATAE